METNIFKLVVNDDLHNMVEVHENILSRDTEMAVTEVEYTVWYRNEQLVDGETESFNDCGDAFRFAVEVVLNNSAK